MTAGKATKCLQRRGRDGLDRLAIQVSFNIASQAVCGRIAIVAVLGDGFDDDLVEVVLHRLNE